MAFTEDQLEEKLAVLEEELPGEFRKGEEGICFITTLAGNGWHLWHNGMDTIYAVGSQIAANRPVPPAYLLEGVEALERHLEEWQMRLGLGENYDSPDEDRRLDIAHLERLIAISRAALAAPVSEDVQSFEG